MSFYRWHSVDVNLAKKIALIMFSVSTEIKRCIFRGYSRAFGNYKRAVNQRNKINVFKQKEGVFMIFSNSLQTSQKMADYLWQKQTITLDNIANQDTPGFKAKFVTFEEELYENLNYMGANSKSRNNAAIKNSTIRTHVKEDESYHLDGNGVNVDVEQAELASTQIQYQQTIQQISSEFAKLRVVIK